MRSMLHRRPISRLRKLRGEETEGRQGARGGGGDSCLPPDAAATWGRDVTLRDRALRPPTKGLRGMGPFKSIEFFISTTTSAHTPHQSNRAAPDAMKLTATVLLLALAAVASVRHSGV